MTKKYKILLGCGLILILIFSISGPSACDCANLKEKSPLKKKYSFEDYDNGKFQSDVNDYVKLEKDCAIKYGNLSDDEKHLAKTATSGTWIPKLYEAIENAKKECKK